MTEKLILWLKNSILANKFNFFKNLLSTKIYFSVTKINSLIRKLFIVTKINFLRIKSICYLLNQFSSNKISFCEWKINFLVIKIAVVTEKFIISLKIKFFNHKINFSYKNKFLVT